MFFVSHMLTNKPIPKWEIELAKKQLETINKIKSEPFRDKNIKENKND